MFQSPDLYATPSGEIGALHGGSGDSAFMSPRTASLMSPRMERALAAYGGVTPTQMRRRPRGHYGNNRFSPASRASPTRPGVNGFRSSLTAPPVLTEIARNQQPSSSSYTELGQAPPSSPAEAMLQGASTGSATFLQSTTNGINILLGVGVLSLPFSFSVSGWLVGAGLLVLLSLTTNYTGKLIGRIMADLYRIAAGTRSGVGSSSSSSMYRRPCERAAAPGSSATSSPG